MEKFQFIKYLVLFLFVCFLKTGFSQDVNFENLANGLRKVGIQMDQPTEGRGKFLNPIKNDIVPHNFRIKLKNEDLEIWVIVKSYDSLNLTTQMPHLEAGRIAMNTATNESEEETVTTVLKLSDEYALETFGADWGREFYFKPKRQLTDKENCRLLSLYKEGTGQIQVLFFFDKKTKGREFYYDMFRFE